MRLPDWLHAEALGPTDRRAGNPVFLARVSDDHADVITFPLLRYHTEAGLGV